MYCDSGELQGFLILFLVALRAIIAFTIISMHVWTFFSYCLFVVMHYQRDYRFRGYGYSSTINIMGRFALLGVHFYCLYWIWYALKFSITSKQHVLHRLHHSVCPRFSVIIVYVASIAVLFCLCHHCYQYICSPSFEWMPSGAYWVCPYDTLKSLRSRCRHRFLPSSLMFILFVIVVLHIIISYSLRLNKSRCTSSL